MRNGYSLKFHKSYHPKGRRSKCRLCYPKGAKRRAPK